MHMANILQRPTPTYILYNIQCITLNTTSKYDPAVSGLSKQYFSIIIC